MLPKIRHILDYSHALLYYLKARIASQPKGGLLLGQCPKR